MTIKAVQDAYNYYLKYDEEKRIKRDRAHMIEFMSSMQTIEKYITPKTRLIDIGCGTGNYSIALAPKCREVLATDLMDNLLDVLRDKIEKEGSQNISCLCANVLDIPQLVDKTYDVILCMGPLYHLNDTETRRQCYENIKKISNPDAVVIFTYLTTHAPFSAVLKGKFPASTFFENQQKDNYYQGAFYFTSPDFIAREMGDNSFEIIEHLALDAICCFCPAEVNAMPDESYENFITTLINNNGNPNLLKLSSHNMVVAKIKR